MLNVHNMNYGPIQLAVCCEYFMAVATHPTVVSAVLETGTFSGRAGPLKQLDAAANVSRMRDSILGEWQRPQHAN
jgi:hypothetical protein